jgi:hypothetical protein
MGTRHLSLPHPVCDAPRRTPGTRHRHRQRDLPAADQLIFDVDAYIAIVDFSGGYISCYQDVEEASGLSGVKLTGWSYTADKTILVGGGQGHVFEWALDGSEVHDVDLSATCGGASGDVGPARTTTRTAAPTTARPT